MLNATDPSCPPDSRDRSSTHHGLLRGTQAGDGHGWRGAQAGVIGGPWRSPPAGQCPPHPPRHCWEARRLLPSSHASQRQIRPPRPVSQTRLPEADAGMESPCARDESAKRLEEKPKTGHEAAHEEEGETRSRAASSGLAPQDLRRPLGLRARDLGLPGPTRPRPVSWGPDTGERDAKSQAAQARGKLKSNSSSYGQLGT